LGNGEDRRRSTVIWRPVKISALNRRTSMNSLNASRPYSVLQTLLIFDNVCRLFAEVSCRRMATSDNRSHGAICRGADQNVRRRRPALNAGSYAATSR
jgi:1,4-dihydroxy-2-naphthoyl-CoA synthase